MRSALEHAGNEVAAMVPEGEAGCVLVRSQRRDAAVGGCHGGPTQARRLAEHTEQTTAALVLGEPTDDELPARYAAVTGCGTQAVHRAARLAIERSGGHWRGSSSTAADHRLVETPLTDRDPAELIEAIAAQMPRGDSLEISAEAHTAVEERLLVPTHGPPVRETLHTGAVVVDVLHSGVRVAEADLAWSGRALPDLGKLAERVEQALQRARAPRRPAPAQVHMLLLDGSAGAFLHEVCGHLLESTRQRPSLLAELETSHVAHHRLSIDDDPRHPAGFGAHEYTMLGMPTHRRPLLTEGCLTGLLKDTPDGPWRAENARHRPQPRMTHLKLAPAPSCAPLNEAIGDACAPVVRVHRLGFGSLDHRDGSVILEVKDATLHEGSRKHRLEPFLVTTEARQALRDVRAVGCLATVQPWSAYCLATSGSLPVGASTPSLLTGPLATLPHRPLAPPRTAVLTSRSR
ncbi:metallopeptidase TldD-related protein [Streptomyces sp. NPDC058690]|uniref:metallopeptidase TldD-related protein n=1 Tax=Streptomyces sp. NPDC058690 TaxID=3346600 RepID=UPI00365702CB